MRVLKNLNSDLTKFFTLSNFFILVLTGCSNHCGYMNMSVVDLNLSSGNIALQTPSASPGDNSNPVFKITGVSEGARVAVYADSTCGTEVGAAIATGENAVVPIGISLADGVHVFTTMSTKEGSDPSSCSTPFTYEIDSQAPSITSLTPTELSTTQPTTITIQGTHFVSDMSIKLGSMECNTVVLLDGNNLTCVATPINENRLDLTIQKQSGGQAALNGSVNFVAGPPVGPVCLDGVVNAITTETFGSVNSRRVFLGGEFTQIGTCSGGAVPISASSGLLAPSFGSFAKVDGYVNAMVSDGAGGYYIGGSFSKVGEVSRINLAHVLPDFSVDQNFASSITAMDGEVRAILYDAGRVYFGGTFNTINNIAHKNLGYFGTDGNLSSWNAGISLTIGTSSVNALALVSQKLYVAGKFNRVNASVFENIAVFSQTSNHAVDTTWAPAVNDTINAFSVVGSNLILGGAFTQIVEGVSTRNLSGLALINTVTGSLSTEWNPNVSGEVFALAASGTELFVGGSFSAVGGISHVGVAQVSAAGVGSVTSWNPGLSTLLAGQGVYAITTDASQVYLGGKFDTVSGLSRINLFAADKNTGVINSNWNPKANNKVRVVVHGNGVLYTGGDFTAIGSKNRKNLVAVNESTGSATNFQFDVDGPVYALSLNGSNLLVGGKFSKIASTSRNSIGEISLNSNTDSLTSWDPNITLNGGNATGSVRTILDRSASQVLVGGLFNRAGPNQTVTGENIAAFDSNGVFVNGSFGAGAFGGAVNMMKRSGNTLYIGGEFTKMEAQNRKSFAVYDLTNNNLVLQALDLLNGNPIVIDFIFASSGGIYVCGALVGNTTDCGYKAPAATSVIPWGPQLASGDFLTTTLPVNGVVDPAATATPLVLIGGSFTHQGAANLMAYTDDVNTVATSPIWVAKLYSRQAVAGVKVLSPSSDGSLIYVGGNFDQVDGKSRSGFIRYNLSNMKLTDP
jgi:hypothetical protein